MNTCVGCVFVWLFFVCGSFVCARCSAVFDRHAATCDGANEGTLVDVGDNLGRQFRVNEASADLRFVLSCCTFCSRSLSRYARSKKFTHSRTFGRTHIRIHTHVFICSSRSPPTQAALVLNTLLRSLPALSAAATASATSSSTLRPRRRTRGEVEQDQQARQQQQLRLLQQRNQLQATLATNRAVVTDSLSPSTATMKKIATKTPRAVRHTGIDVKAENEDDGDNDVVDHAKNDDETVRTSSSVVNNRRHHTPSDNKTDKVFFSSAFLSLSSIFFSFSR